MRSAAPARGVCVAIGVRVAIGGIAIGVCVAILAGCAVGPNFKRPPAPNAPGYGSAPMQGRTADADGTGGTTQRFAPGMDIPSQWWTLFRSPGLDRLVEASLKGNQTPFPFGSHSKAGPFAAARHIGSARSVFNRCSGTRVGCRSDRCVRIGAILRCHARWGLTPVWGLSLRLPHRIGMAKASEMMLTCRSYSGTQAEAMHLALFCG